MNYTKLICLRAVSLLFVFCLFFSIVYSNGLIVSNSDISSESLSTVITTTKPQVTSSSSFTLPVTSTPSLQKSFPSFVSSNRLQASSSVIVPPLLEKFSDKEYPLPPIPEENITHFESLEALQSYLFPDIDASYLNEPLADNYVMYPPEEYVSREEYISLLRASAQTSNTRSRYNDSLSSVPNFWGTAPTKGSYKVPVFLMSFTDIAPTFDVDYYEELFNSDDFMDGDGISVSKYFYQQSYGDLNITFDVHDWVNLNGPRDSYSGPNMFNIILDTFSIQHSLNVDFSEYDSIGNNRLDGAIIIISGAHYTIPYHTRILKEYNTHSYGGYYLGNTSIINEKLSAVQCQSWINNPEYNYPTDCRTSVVHNTHEFAHILGLPDLYGINPETGAAGAYGYETGGLGNWDMMTTNREPLKPINLSAWPRYFFGWLEPKFIGTFGPTYEEHEDLCQKTTVPLRSYSHYSDSVILSNYYGDHMNDREFFLTVNRFADLDDPGNLDNAIDPNLSSTSANPHLGLSTWHIDEEYIEDNYLTNSIMWDPDQYILLDCYIIYNRNPDYPGECGSPGLVPEDNIACASQPMLAQHVSFRTNKIITFERNNQTYYFDLSYFDKHMRLDDICTTVNNPVDAISNSYNLTWDTRTSIRALDPSGFTIRGRFNFQECYGDPFCTVRESVSCPLER